MIDKRELTDVKGVSHGKQRSYNEIVEYLDKHWDMAKDAKVLDRMKKLDKALGSPAEKLNTLLVAGTNGKSLTIHLAAKLLKEEGLKVGTFYAPHILTYNERFATNHETISNKVFTELANDIINTAEQLNIASGANEILTMMALLYFKQQNVDVAILEVNSGGKNSPVNLCHPKVVTITRIIPSDEAIKEEDAKALVAQTMAIVKEGTWVVSGDQSKTHLQYMNEMTDAQGGNWAMPIRKLAPLAYPYEQLHGRCAALAERLAELFIENFYNKNVTITSSRLLSKPTGPRGRPTLEARKRRDENPEKTLDQFWKEELNELPGRFQILDKEKPTVLLDVASNIDAFKNVLLGIRLLHYQRPLKGLTIIVGAAKDTMNNEEFSKLVRYFFKKTPGQLIICPIESCLAGISEDQSWDIEKITNDVKSMKIKAKTGKNFEEAFDLAKKSVDEKHGLVVITGSRSIVNNYWRYKGIKKL